MYLEDHQQSLTETMLANRIENQPQNSSFFSYCGMFPAVTQPGRFACMPQEGGLGAIQPIEPQMHLSFLSLQLGTVDSGVSGFRLSERQHQFRNRVIFQMPRHHILDAQGSYFRCSSIQRRYAETHAFTSYHLNCQEQRLCK